MASDLFELDSKHYIIVINYNSRYFELAQLKDETTESVIEAMKDIFARHRIPMLCHSDNGSCYSSAQFKQFVLNHGFTRTTSSSRFAQANGEAERAVRTAKEILCKSSNPYLDLLAYRSTPLSCGYSPAELLKRRQLHSTVPVANNNLTPNVASYNNLQKLDTAIKLRQKNDRDRRHRARYHISLQVIERIWVPDIIQQGRVMHALPYRAYQLQLANSAIIKRNARSIRRDKPPHVLSYERASITKAIDIEPLNTLTNKVPTQQKNTAAILYLCGPTM